MQWLTGSQIPARENNIIILRNGTHAFYKYNTNNINTLKRQIYAQDLFMQINYVSQVQVA